MRVWCHDLTLCFDLASYTYQLFHIVDSLIDSEYSDSVLLTAVEH